MNEIGCLFTSVLHRLFELSLAFVA